MAWWCLDTSIGIGDWIDSSPEAKEKVKVKRMSLDALDLSVVNVWVGSDQCSQYTNHSIQGAFDVSYELLMFLINLEIIVCSNLSLCAVCTMPF